MSLANFGADFWRFAVSFFASARTFMKRLSTSVWRFSSMPSRFTISRSLCLASFPWLMTSVSEAPYLRLRFSNVLILFDSLFSSSGSTSSSPEYDAISLSRSWSSRAACSRPENLSEVLGSRSCSS